MLRIFLFLSCSLSVSFLSSQDLSIGLVANDLATHPMQPLSNPAYLDTVIDPSFGTTIRRISDAGTGGLVVPMYSTIQAWNADESMMILYEVGVGHQLLNGMDYSFIRYLSDVSPIDLEQIFWDFNDPDVLYFPESGTNDFIKYTVSAQNKQVIVNLATVSGCTSGINMGNDVQMMSWDSDVIAFRCGNSDAYSYRISTGNLTTFALPAVDFTAPMPGPSGNRFYHGTNVYSSTGAFDVALNEASVEHSCLGKTTNGVDAHFAIAFASGPNGGCLGDIIAHDMQSGACTPMISQGQGYAYPQSGTHISALAHNNSQEGWVAASMMGYDLNGQDLLDQELVIAREDASGVSVYRVGHHRSDEDEFNYWGEPHVCISPSGTRLLFGSDWSGADDGLNVDSYVVELPVHSISTSVQQLETTKIKLYPVPAHSELFVVGAEEGSFAILSLDGVTQLTGTINKKAIAINNLAAGCYILRMDGAVARFIIE